MWSKPACWSLSLAGARYSSSFCVSFSPHPSRLIHSICAPAPPVPVAVCVSTCPKSTHALQGIHSVSSSFHPVALSFPLFFLSWPFLFLYHFNLTLQALPCLPHAPLYAAHIIGLAACLSKKIEGLFYIV